MIDRQWQLGQAYFKVWKNATSSSGSVKVWLLIFARGRSHLSDNNILDVDIQDLNKYLHKLGNLWQTVYFRILSSNPHDNWTCVERGHAQRCLSKTYSGTLSGLGESKDIISPLAVLKAVVMAGPQYQSENYSSQINTLDHGHYGVRKEWWDKIRALIDGTDSSLLLQKSNIYIPEKVDTITARPINQELRSIMIRHIPSLNGRVW